MIEHAHLAVLSYEDITRQVRRTWRHCSFRLIARLPRPSTWTYLLDRRNEQRVFALTVPRIWLAYAAGSLRYGVFVAERAAAGGSR
jgi:tocopherol O-methyltransferase